MPDVARLNAWVSPRVASAGTKSHAWLLSSPDWDEVPRGGVVEPGLPWCTIAASPPPTSRESRRYRCHADADERRVPAPLTRVLVAARQRRRARPVRLQDFDGSIPQRAHAASYCVRRYPALTRSAVSASALKRLSMAYQRSYPRSSRV